MPYTIRKFKDGYKVCKKDNPEKCFSKEPITEEMAKKQEKAIILSEMRGGAVPLDLDLYKKIKDKVYKQNPVHSAYRSMQIVREYKKAGGKYEDDGEKNTQKWLGQKWSSVNDYYHNDEVVPCGSSNTQEKFNEYPLCRPLAIIKELSKDQLKIMIDNKKYKSPLRTESVLGTDKFNIKNTVSGGLKPLTARIGGKVLLKKKIVDEYFPDSSSYSTYVEPFLGGGSVYLYKNKDDHKEIINDLDPDIYVIFKGFKDYPANKIAEDVNGDYDKKDFETIINSNPKTDYNRFLKTFLTYRLSFFGRGITFGKPRISSNFRGYQERLKNTEILNKDYKEIIKKYDKPSTFFYLDPPARESSGNYKYDAINIPELLKILKTIKGKFLLSIANIDVKKEMFKPYRVVSVTNKYVGQKNRGGQSKKVKEFLVMNYEPKKVGGNDEEEIEVNKTLPLHEAANEYIEFLKKPFNFKARFGRPPITDFQSFLNENHYYILPVDGTVCSNKDAEVMIQFAMPKIDYPSDYSQAKEHLKRTYGYTVDKTIQGHKLIDKDGFDIVFGGNKPVAQLESKIGFGCSGCMGACGGAVSDFQTMLNDIGFKPSAYLKKAKELAKHNGYDPSKVLFCDRGTNKLMYQGPDGLSHFGNPKYHDYIIYSFLEHKGKVPEGTADKRRELYRARATKIKGNWKKNKYSPNNLAINILW